MEVRTYQNKAVESARKSVQAGNKRIIIQGSCGSGKTIIAALMIKNALQKGKRVIFLVHYRQLAFQAMERFTDFGMGNDVGIIMAGEEARYGRPVQIISVQTYGRRLNLDDHPLFLNSWFQKADLVFYDECVKDTEILTENGWVLMEHLKSEKVAQYNQDDRSVSFVLPTRKIKRYHNGQLINFYRKNSIDLTGTPGHEQPYFITASNRLYKQTFCDWKASGSNAFPVAGYGTGIRKLTFRDRFKIMAAADGSLVTGGSVQFQFSKQQKINRFLSIVNECGYNFTENKPIPAKNNIKRKRRFLVHKPKGIDKKLRNICPINQITWSFAQDFIRELVRWDGSVKPSLYWSGKDSKDADYIQALCALGGITASRFTQKDSRKKSYKTMHRMIFSFRDSRGCQGVKKSFVNYKGMVYCVTVPDGNIIIRQKGRVIITGNCHASIAKTRKAILDLYKDSAVIVGLTATPCRADGRPLGAIYQDIITVSSIQELTELGFLVPAVYYGAKKLPDLKNIPIVAGDYNKKVLGKRVDKPKLVGDILENWLRIGCERPTVVFASNVKHSLHIKELFIKWGIDCEHVDAHTPPLERQGILARFKSGKTQVVTNVNVYSEGADFPWASCVVLAKPTFSFMRYWQMAGRGLRPYPGKQDCIIIDHAGNVERHGFMDDPVIWTLEGKERAWTKPKTKDKEKPPLICDQCQTQFRGLVCPRCGLRVKFYGKRIECVEARLCRLDKEKKQALNYLAIEKEKKQFLRMAEYHCREKKYNPGWVAHTYYKKYRAWPPRNRDYAMERPDRGFRNYLLYLWIRNNKGRNKKA